MKKALILATLIFALCSWLNADDYVIGNGTSNQSNIPVNGATNYGWSKFFFTASELQAAGMSGTVQISKLGFQLINGTWENYVTNDQRIYIRESYDSAYPTNPTYANPSGYTAAFIGTISWSGPGWVFVTLDNPYSYTYNNNPDIPNGIEILWENRDGSSATGAPKFAYASTSNYSAAYKTGSTFPTTYGTKVKTRPNTWFISPATDIPNPATCTVPLDGSENIDITTNLSWISGGGDPDDYLFSLWKTDPLVTIANNFVTTSTTYDPAEYLDYGTTYYWRVIPRNSFGNAVDCPTWSFTTIPDPSIVDFPWTEDFDGSTFPPSDNWMRKGGELADPIVLVGSSLWVQDDWLNIAGTDKAARMDPWGTMNGWLISPLLNVTDASHYLMFDLAFLKYNQPPTGTPPTLNGVDDRFVVLIGDGFTWSTANIVREWNNSDSPYVLNDISNWGEQVAIPLSDHTGHIRIAFYAGSTISNADNDFMINNLYVGTYLLEPQVSITYNGDSGVSLAWPAVSGATSYQVYWSDDPYGTWNLLDSTASTTYSDTNTSSKRFYQVQAINTP